MCVVKGPTQGAMARTKEAKNDGTVHLLPKRKKVKAQAESKETPPPSRPLNEETLPPSRPLNEETLPPSRPLNEETPPSRPLNEENPALSKSSGGGHDKTLRVG